MKPRRTKHYTVKWTSHPDYDRNITSITNFNKTYKMKKEHLNRKVVKCACITHTWSIQVIRSSFSGRRWARSNWRKRCGDNRPLQFSSACLSPSIRRARSSQRPRVKSEKTRDLGEHNQSHCYALKFGKSMMNKLPQQITWSSHAWGFSLVQDRPGSAEPTL